MSKAERLGAGELAAGAMVRLKQPRLPAMVGEVAELERDGSFSPLRPPIVCAHPARRSYAP
ncbi:MAG: hypothetical protein ACYCU5_15760 [Actinomycetes bacterium]